MTLKELQVAKENYNSEYNTFMQEWETEIRKWLKEQNKDDTATFYSDGVYNPEQWFSQDFRPLFVLFEVNESEEKKSEEKKPERAFCYFLDEQDIKKETTWHKLVSLAYGIEKYMGNKSENFPYYKLFKNYEENKDEYDAILKKIAIMNLKKIAGGSNVGSDKSLKTLHYKQHIEKYREKLKEQIEYICPTTIICCGSGIWTDMMRILGVEKNSEETLKASGAKKFEVNNIKVVDFVHPANRGKFEANYAYAKAIFEEIKEQQNV